MNRRAVTVAVQAALALAGAAARAGEPDAGPFLVMGTVAEVVPGASERDRGREYAGIARRVFDELNAELSLYRTNSPLSRLNAAAGIEWVPIGPHLRRNLDLAVRYAELSQGTFDVTAGPLVRLWGFSAGAAPAGVPSAEAIASAREKVGIDNLRIGEGKAFLARHGMTVDLGGIAKGYAVDVCWEELRRKGARNFLVNLGGNIRVSGGPESGRSWRVGVRNPFDPAGGLAGTLELPDGMAVSTSGQYERFVTIDGKKYGHIIDPRSGRPAEGVAAVTVTGPTAADADGLDTGLFILGPLEGARVLRGLTNVAALFVPDRQPAELLATSGFEQRFTPEPDWAGRFRRLAP